MQTEQYRFVAEALEDNEGQWRVATKLYNEEYKEGLSANALQKRFNRETEKLETLGNDPVEKAVKIVKNQPVKPTELARRLNLDLDGLEDLMDDLLNNRAAIKYSQGYLVFDKTAPFPDNLNHTIDLFTNEEWVKLGIYSDPHIGSINEQLPLMHSFYKICEEEKVAAMFCAGDLTPGNGTVYKGQMHDLKIYGVDKQINYVCNTWPNTDLMTYTISGNHDLDVYKTAGIDIVQQIADRMENITYLGKMSATIECQGVKLLLMHGDGGAGSIRSYKPQRVLDNQRKEDICDVSVLGHWHISLYLPGYRESIVILPGCFEAQSEYLVKKGLIPDVCGVILHLKLADINGKKKIIRHKVDFLDFNVLMG